MTKAEQETVIRWDRESDTASVFSADPVVWRKMARLGVQSHKNTTQGGEVVGKFFRVPVGHLRWSVRAPSAVKRAGNPEALAKARAARSAA